MSFGLLWLSTVIMSDFMLAVSVLRAIKDLVDEGYKLTVENKKIERNEDNSNLLTFLILLVPVANILYMLSFSALVVNNKNALFDEFRIRNMLKEMTNEEKEEYIKNPTLLNAFNICMRREKTKLKEQEKLTFKLNFESIEGQIEYTLENSEVKIISSTVDSNKYDLKTQNNIVKAVIKLYYERNFKNKEDYDECMLSNPQKIIDGIKNYKIEVTDEDIIKKYYLEFKLLDKYNEAMKNKNEAERLEKELDENKELTSEKLEMINKLKSKYRELIIEASKIDNDLSKSNNEEKETNEKVLEERKLKK